MLTDVPIACSLDAAGQKQRLAEMRAIGRDALLDIEAVANHAVLRFRTDAQTRLRLEAIVAAESRCCPFMSFAMAEEPGAIVLRIEAPAGAGLVVEDMLTAFAGGC